MTANRNADVANMLSELATLTTLDEGDPNAFRVRAYRTAARAVESFDGDIGALSVDDLARLRGIGRSIAARIGEYLTDGRVGRLEELRARYPAEQVELTRIPGLGPKSIAKLDAELGVRDLDGLIAALDDGRVAELDGFGQRSVDKLRNAIEALGLESKQRRVPLADALPVGERICAVLRELPDVDDVALAGSARRFNETVGDLDIIISASTAIDVLEHVDHVVQVERVIGAGATKTSFVIRDGLQVDVRQVAAESFGAALVYFTGSAAHNIRLRQRANERGRTLNEYGFRPMDAPDGPPRDGASEADVYAALDLPWIWPEIREDAGEIERAEAGSLAAAGLDEDDIRGDLHDHTALSGDGRMTLHQLIDHAIARGWEYIAVTDHGEDLAINGASREQLRAQRSEIRVIERERDEIRVLHGAELNIGPDGDLDYDGAFRAEFDWIVASVHSHFDRDVDAQTNRVIRAMEDPTVTAIGHLTGRMIGRRPPITLDFEAVFDAALRTGTAVEVNASLSRLDPAAALLRDAARAGVVFTISTDAHARDDLDRMRFGVAHGRRAGLVPRQVLNTWPLAAFEDWLAQQGT